MGTIDPKDAKQDALKALLPGFLKNRRDDVMRIRKAVESGDFETIARIAHNLRGNGASYGFPELSTIGEAIEVATNQRNTESILEIAARLEQTVIEIAGRA